MTAIRLEKLTSELRIEQALKVLDHAYDEIFVCDAKYKVLYVNSACERHYGMKPHELIGKTYWDLVEKDYWYPTVLPKVYDERRTITIKQTSYLGETIITTAVPIFDEQGEIEMVVMSVRDNMYEIELVREAMNQEFDLNHQRAEDLLKGAKGNSPMIFKSPLVRRIINHARRFAQVDATVLIQGESGTGKGLLANFMHEHSERKNAPFLPINCAAIPEELMESELFGYRRGAFTGAVSEGKVGLLQMAHKGTLFLDEIGDLSLRLQAKLLHVLQEKQFIPVGGGEPIKVDVRIIAATHQKLHEMLKEGTFREDLYYRLNVLALEIPPLRQRREDIRPLLHHYLNKFNRKYQCNAKLSTESMELLCGYNWPGNIRQLENMVERLVVVCGHGMIHKDSLPAVFLKEEAKNSALEAYEKWMLSHERALVVEAYRRYPSTRKVAEALAISQTKASKLIRKHIK